MNTVFAMHLDKKNIDTLNDLLTDFIWGTIVNYSVSIFIDKNWFKCEMNISEDEPILFLV